MSNDEGYPESESYMHTANSMISVRDPHEEVLIFISDMLSLADDYADLEARVTSHQLAWCGLSKNGLEELDAEYSELADRLSQNLSVISAPHSKLFKNDQIVSEYNQTTANQLATVVHGEDDVEDLIARIEHAHERIGNNIASKRQVRASMLILSASAVAVAISILSLLASFV